MKRNIHKGMMHALYTLHIKSLSHSLSTLELIFMHIDTLFDTWGYFRYVWDSKVGLTEMISLFFFVACLFPTSLNPEILEGLLGAGLLFALLIICF